MEKGYDNKLSQIIEQYTLEYNGIIDSTEIHNIIMKLFQKKCLGKRVALWGAGRSNSLNSHASVILARYASFLRGLVCIIDSAIELQGTEFMHYPVIAPDEIKNRDVEVIVVASRGNAKSICESIRKYAPNCDVLDIYQELRDCGIVIPYNFYEEHSLYTELFDLRTAYEQETDFYKRGTALKKLISAYLYIRDIPYAIDFCQEYIKQEYEKFEEVQKFLHELLQLINEIKEKNQMRNGDCIIHFIDALRAMDIITRQGDEIQYNYLKDYFDSMLFFENAYSTAPTTYESMRAIVCEQYSYEVNVYQNNFIYKFDEFPLLQDALKKGYEIFLYASDEWRIMFEDERIRYVNQIHMSDKLWTLMCDRAESDNSMFAFLYYPWELHYPLTCGYHTKKPHLPAFADVGIVDMSDYIEQQFLDCLKYVDKQFTFYREFYNNETWLNIFSDHSQIMYDNENFMPYYMYYNNKERATHCTMAIGGPNVEHGVFKDYFSMIDYNKVMRQLLAGGKIDIPKRDILHWQYYSIHNKKLREAAEERGYTDYVDGIDCFMTDSHIYSCTIRGKEEVYRIGDTKNNVIDTEEGKACVEKVRNVYGESVFPEFLDIHYVS